MRHILSNDDQNTRRFYLGCAVWAYRGFVGPLYPEGSNMQDALSLYTERLTAVEGNTTFYALPPEETVLKWREAMPPSFAFCPKLDRRITHEAQLVQTEQLTERFLERMRLLGDNLGPILLQLPPSFSPTSFTTLKRYLERWPPEVEVAVEVRHPGWWQDAPARGLAELLTRHNAARVLLDTRPVYQSPDDPQAVSERKKPNIPLNLELTAPFTMVRFIAHPHQEHTDPFLEEWVDTLDTWLAASDDLRVYFFSHCPVEERSPVYARQLHEQLEARHPWLPALPWDTAPTPPKQLGLFG